MSAASRLAHYRRLESQLATAEQVVAAKRREIDTFLIKLSGIEPGDLVTVPDGRTARVVRVVPRSQEPWEARRSDETVFSKPLLRVNYSKVDGTWSAVERTAHNWMFACRPSAAASTVSAQPAESFL